MLKNLVLRTRSYRRFDESHDIDLAQLRDMVDHARLSASGMNNQPLKFILITRRDIGGLVFPHLKWAGYLKDWDGPEEGERPSAYILMLHDTEVSNNIFYDPGIAGQSIMLSATEKGFGGCMMAAIDRDKIREALSIEERFEIKLVIALGKPAETVAVDPVVDGDIKYWRDDDDVHHVPKRSLNELIVEEL